VHGIGRMGVYAYTRISSWVLFEVLPAWVWVRVMGRTG
jgi:hypothetical protein